MNSHIISRSTLYSFGSAVVAALIFCIIAAATGSNIANIEVILGSLVTGAISFAIGFICFMIFLQLAAKKQK